MNGSTANAKRIVAACGWPRRPTRFGAHNRTMKPDEPRLADLLELQCGVISRKQVLASDFRPTFIRSNLRCRRWAPVFPGIYVNHTGPLTWEQRAWSAILDAEPAALSHSSALRDADASDSEPIHIIVDRTRLVTRRTGVVVHYGSHLDSRVLWNTSPPRMRSEEAVLQLAAAASSETRVIAILADAVGARRTTPKRLHLFGSRTPLPHESRTPTCFADPDAAGPDQRGPPGPSRSGLSRLRCRDRAGWPDGARQRERTRSRHGT